MGETARYSTPDRFAEFEKLSRLVRRSVRYSWFALLARCFCLTLLYYILVVVIMKFRFYTSGLSLLWPSNALLVATLVLAPKRRWWLYLLSIVPAHVAAMSPYHLGLSWLAYQIAFNSLEAIACAAILRRFRSPTLYFDTLDGVSIFLGVSVVVPGLANLVAVYPIVKASSRAALLAHNSSDGFLAVWASCWANNSASLIIFVPVILICVTRGRNWIRSLSWRAVGEAALLTVSLTTLTFQSYGGYLTALALGRNSDVFAAGVDLHGVHDRLPAINPAQLAHALVGDGLSEADLRQALKVEFDSSPISAVATWKSPVLLIHGDDDRTVDFHQTVDLGRRLAEKHVKVEELVLPDDVHDSLLWRNWTAEMTAAAEFFERTLLSGR